MIFYYKMLLLLIILLMYFFIQVREACEAKAGLSFEEFTAVTYKTQVVAGTNFFVKVISLDTW